MGKATRGRTRLQILSDSISKIYKDLKKGSEDRSGWQSRLHCHKSAVSRQKTEKE